MIGFVGFAPDLDPSTPGVITDCIQLIPNERGMEAAPSAVAAVSGLGNLAAECRGAAVLTNTSGTRRTFAGTQTKIYELASGTWSDVSGMTFTGSSENRWCFAQFGNVALASNDTEQIVASTSGTFAAVSGAPKARVILSIPNFVVALNTDSSAYGDAPDRWHTSAFQDYSSWTANVTTQATTGRLIGNGGELTAGFPFGNGLVAYKAREMFLGQYVGPPIVLQFDRVPGEQGCVGPEAVDDIGGAHIFVGEDNIWMYDGSRPVPIAQDTVRQWFFNDLNATYKYRTIVKYDRNNGRVWIFYPSTTSSGNPDSALVYHLATKRWGRANRNIEAAVNFVSPGITWDTLSSLASTWDTLPSIPWDSQSWQASGRALAVFNSTNGLVTLTGSGEDSGMTTGDFGDNEQVSFVDKVRVRFFTQPTTSTVTGQTRMELGGSSTTAGSGAFANNKYDIRQSGRWHRFSFLFTGSHEVSGIDVPLKRAGKR
ncbi:MAG TPA: hypothetical protein PK365_12145 [Nitrospira sp.]|nr:hypothetical protein [Nitrospira sp.]HNG01971.1 hypothetical protein [Nitrospira sp.]